MKKEKERINWSEAIGELVMEVVFTLIFCGIGAFIVSLFGVDLGSEMLDSDLLTLIGIAALIGISALIGAVFVGCCFVFGIRKLLKNRKK